MNPPKINKNSIWKEYYGEIKTNKDWYLRFGQLKDLFYQLTDYSGEILDIGAGSSKLSEELNEAGYQNVTCIDFVEQNVTYMQQQVQNSQYIYMDAKNLQFPNSIFDVIVVKGTFDFMTEDITEACQIVVESHRALKLNGALLVITQITPEIIRKIINVVTWNVIYESNFESNNGCICNVGARAEVVVFVCLK